MTDGQPEFRGFFRQYFCLQFAWVECIVQAGIGQIYRETLEWVFCR